MLIEQQRTTVKATVPVLRSHGETITSQFYDTMLSAHPALFNYFNPANQLGEGGQARSLAASVLAYAENIDRLDALAGMVERICEKHVSLEILPEHYPIVGQYLLGAIADVLGDAATPEILSARPATRNSATAARSGFMAATEHLLDELGVAAQRRHNESFAPSAYFAVTSPSAAA